MDRFLASYSLLKLSKEKIVDLNRPITCKKIKIVSRNPLKDQSHETKIGSLVSIPNLQRPATLTPLLLQIIDEKIFFNASMKVALH